MQSFKRDSHLSLLAFIAELGGLVPAIWNALISDSLASIPSFAAFICLGQTFILIPDFISPSISLRIWLASFDLV